MSKNIDHLKCTIDGVPMENLFSGIPTIQNGQEWIDEERRKREYYNFLHSLIDTIKARKK